MREGNDRPLYWLRWEKESSKAVWDYNLCPEAISLLESKST